ARRGHQGSIKRLSSAKGGRLTVHPGPPSIVPTHDPYDTSAFPESLARCSSPAPPMGGNVESVWSGDRLRRPRVRCTWEKYRGLQAPCLDKSPVESSRPHPAL